MSDRERLVFHLAPASTVRRNLRADGYAPPSLAKERFIHCTATAGRTLQVAADYFSGVEEPLLVLAIEPARLHAPLYYESAAPIEGGGTAHLADGALFPHLYGALNLDAVVGAAELGRDGPAFAWPAQFGPLGAWLG